MMKVKTGDVFNSVQPLAILGSLKLPVLGALKVAKCSRAVADAIKPAEEVRNKIVTDSAKKDKKGNPVLKKDENGKTKEGAFEFEDEDSVVKKVNELMETETEINLNSKIKISSLGDVEVQGAVLSALLWLIEE